MSVVNVVSWRSSIIRNIIAADHIQTIGYNRAHNIIISFNLLSSNTLIIHAKTYWSEKTLKSTVVLNNKEIYWELKSIPHCISYDHFSRIVSPFMIEFMFENVIWCRIFYLKAFSDFVILKGIELVSFTQKKECTR